MSISASTTGTEQAEKLTFQAAMKWTGHQMAQTWVYIFTFKWAEGLLSWLILSAGTLSGCVFFLSGLWFMIDASVHPFIEAIVSGQLNELLASGHTDIVLSWLATTAFTGLPEFLLPLATYTVFKHFKTWRYTKEKEPMIWFWLFFIPAVVFLLVTVVTLGFSIASDGMTSLDLSNLNVEALAKSQFTLPVWIIVPRGIVAFFYGFFSLIYLSIGKPSEADRLREKDNTIAQLRQEMTDKLAELNQQNMNMLSTLEQNKDAIIAQLRQENKTLTLELDSHKREMEQVKELLAEYKIEKQQLINTVNQGSDAALQAYGEDVIEWLKSGVKTVSRDDITRYTGHSKKKIEEGITQKILQKTTRNDQLILVDSLINWLKITPAPKSKTEPKTEPSLHIVHA